MLTNEIDATTFIATLSEKGQKVVEEYFPHFKKKPTFAVTISDVSKVLYDDDEKYKIFVKSGNKPEIEYNFMHEFFHCVQHEEGFPSLHITSTDAQIDGDILSSYILDFNVRYLLKKYQYEDNSNYDIILYNTLFNIFNCFEKQSIAFLIGNRIDNGTAAAYLISQKDNSKNRKLLSLIKKRDKKTFEICQFFLKILSEYDYNTVEGVHNIFKCIQDYFVPESSTLL